MKTLAIAQFTGELGRLFPYESWTQQYRDNLNLFYDYGWQILTDIPDYVDYEVLTFDCFDYVDEIYSFNAVTYAQLLEDLESDKDFENKYQKEEEILTLDSLLSKNIITQEQYDQKITETALKYDE